MIIPITRASYWRKSLKFYCNTLIERWANIGLRTKMGTIVVVGLVGLLTIFALLAISTAHQVAEQVLNERVAIAHLVADNLDGTFEYLENILPVVANQEALRNPQASLAEREAVVA